MDIENLHDKWKSLGAPGDSASSLRDSKLLARLRSERFTPQAERLRRRYNCLGIIGLLFPCIALLLRSEHEFSIWLLVTYSAFGVIFGILNFFVARRIASASETIMSLPVVESVIKVERLNLMRMRFRTIGIVLSIPLLLWLLFEISMFDQIALWAGIVGALIGIIVSIILERRCNREFHALIDALRQPEASE